MKTKSKKRKLLNLSMGILIGIFVVIQFIPTKLNQAGGDSTSDFIKANYAPDAIAYKLKTACYDCHSNNTRYPWYSKIQPTAWFLEGHIEEGKEELNFSEWDTYSSRRKKSKLKSIISQIKNDEMPLASYTLIHRDAKLSENEKYELVKWLEQLKDTL